MAVIDCIHAPRTSSSSTSNFGTQGVLKVRELYTVTTDPGTTLPEIYQADGLPRQGDPHPDNFYLRVVNIEQPTQKSPIFYEIWIDYATFTSDVTGGSPTDVPAEVAADYDDYEEECDEDADGNPVRTVNGERLSITRPFSDLVLTITKAVPSWNPFFWARIKNRTNSDTFLGMEPGTGLFKGQTARSVEKGSLTYWVTTSRIHFRDDERTTPDKAWYARRIHEGFYARVSSSDPVTSVSRIVDYLGEPIVSPALLKSDGTKVTDPTDLNQIHYLEIKRFKSVLFNALNLF